MITRTHTTTPEIGVHSQGQQYPPLEKIEEIVNERGFYLYEWISPEELRMTVQADYLSIVRRASMPLAIITLIVGVIGLSTGLMGSIFSILLMLGIFYVMVFLYLIVRMMRRAYLYTRGADVIITDNHYVSGDTILEKKDINRGNSIFQEIGKIFLEPLFQPSGLSEYIHLEKKSLFNQLREIASKGMNMINKLGRSRNSGGIILVILIGGILYGIMMAGVYFIGVFFVSLLARLFSWIAHKILIITNNLEYNIQNLFSQITEHSITLKSEKKHTLNLLEKARENKWMDNLSRKLDLSFREINTQAELSLDKSQKLKNLLEKSKYKDIFNFPKYNNWIQKQILEPIEEILILLGENSRILDISLKNIEGEISNTKESSLRHPLELQKKRLLLQKESLERIIKILNGYKEKLV